MAAWKGLKNMFDNKKKPAMDSPVLRQVARKLRRPVVGVCEQPAAVSCVSV